VRFYVAFSTRNCVQHARHANIRITFYDIFHHQKRQRDSYHRKEEIHVLSAHCRRAVMNKILDAVHHRLKQYRHKPGNYTKHNAEQVHKLFVGNPFQTPTIQFHPNRFFSRFHYGCKNKSFSRLKNFLRQILS